MFNNRYFSVCVIGLALLCASLIGVRPAFAASKEKVLRKFNAANGGYSIAPLVFDSAGNLYGTTEYGGSHGLGVVFERTPGTNGKWTGKVLHSFNGPDGASPGSGLVSDSAGNLYGATTEGGSSRACSMGCGTIFRLSLGQDGRWKRKLLYSFKGGRYDSYPLGNLVLDSAGNLYGTTWSGGTYATGTAFELCPHANGKWTKKALHSFGRVKDGSFPFGITIDAHGNLYGTTAYGGVSDQGSVFELTPSSTGPWNETVLYSFCSASNYTDGDGPFGLTLDTVGNLYGVTVAGGSSDNGTVFELVSGENGHWTETILHSFSGKDGDGPQATVVFDKSGALYGTTGKGGTNGDGVVFKLIPEKDGQWNEMLVHDFDGKNGLNPFASLIFDAEGNLYGTTAQGGNLGNVCTQDGGQGCGVVFEITP
jgi:uncharacterized repeat protein (TIGR03803 family)